LGHLAARLSEQLLFRPRRRQQHADRRARRDGDSPHREPILVEDLLDLPARL